MNLLLTAAGTGNAFSYANAVAKYFPEVNLFTADTNQAEYVTASIFAKQHFQIEPISSAVFTQQLEAIVIANDIDYYLPLIDIEVIKSYQSEALSKIIVGNSIDFVNACVTKSLYEQSFIVPNLYFPQKYTSIEKIKAKKVVAKKNGGFGGRNTMVLEKESVTLEILGEFTLYEHIEGDEYTIDCFPRDSGVSYSVRQRIEVKNGVCTKAKISKNDVLEQISNDFVKKYKLIHPFCYQVIERANNFYLIDFNPRLGAGSALNTANGIDFFAAHIAVLMNKDASQYLTPISENCIVTRQYANYLMKAW